MFMSLRLILIAIVDNVDILCTAIVAFRIPVGESDREKSGRKVKYFCLCQLLFLGFPALRPQ